MKKYIIPFLFLIMTFVMIPKQAYYKKEKINIKIELSEPSAKGYFYVRNVDNIFRDKNIYYFNQSLSDEKFDNYALNRSLIRVRSKNGYIKKIELNKKELALNGRFKIYEFDWKKIEEFYKFNLANLIIYILLIFSMNRYFFKEGVDFFKKNIFIFSIGIYFLSIAINQNWSSKILGVILSYAFIKILFEKEKQQFDRIDLSIGMMLLLSFGSEYFGYKNYSQMYRYFQHTLLLIIVLKRFKAELDLEAKEQLKKYLKYSITLSIVINMISPLVMSGIYIFTFGLLSTILLLDSFNSILDYKEKSKIDILVNLINIFLASYSLVFSDRRTMMLIVIIYVFYKILKILFIKNKKLLSVSVLVIIFALITIKSGHLNVESKVIKKVQSIFTIKGNQSNYQRVLMWRRGGYIFLENPLLGIGVDSFYSEAGKDKYLDIKHKDEKFNKNFNHIHNEYIHQLISRGIFGAILFFGLWYYILKSFRKSKDKEFDITLLIIYSVYGIFDSYSVRIDSIFIYIFIGITFINTLKEETEKNRVIEKLAYFSTIAIFLVGLYFNKRFRYYFLISLVLYLIHYLYKKRKRVKL